jgi:hypothetical protein
MRFPATKYVIAEKAQMFQLLAKIRAGFAWQVRFLEQTGLWIN